MGNFELQFLMYGCQPKNRGKTSKMDGLFHGNPYEQMDDLGEFYHPLAYFWFNTRIQMN